jgi:Predicted glycosyltransferases
MTIKKKLCPRVSIIILNWNGWEDTIECLESLYQINYDNYNVILVDNDSKDESIKEIKNHFSNELDNKLKNIYSHDLNIKVLELEENNKNYLTFDIKHTTHQLILLKNSKNYGYAKGNNIGMILALEEFCPDYILLLNNDTTVDKNFLKELMNSIKIQEKIGKERVGIYAPKILKSDDPHRIDSAGHIISWGRIVDRGSKKVDRNQYDNKISVIGAKGAAALYKTEMLESIGLLEESFITSYEDAELSWRAYKNSWKAVYVPKSIVYHKGERSIRKKNSKLAYFRGLTLKNQTLTVEKYGNLNQKILFALILISQMMASYMPVLRHKFNAVRYDYISAIREIFK